MLGSIDANRGDYQNGWDTDQFPIDNYELTQAMMQIIRNDGLGNGGTNLMPRPVVTPPILKISSSLILPVWMQWHVLWRALQNCSKNLLTRKMLADRYASFDNGKGKEFEDGKLTWKMS